MKRKIKKKVKIYKMDSKWYKGCDMALRKKWAGKLTVMEKRVKNKL